MPDLTNGIVKLLMFKKLEKIYEDDPIHFNNLLEKATIHTMEKLNLSQEEVENALDPDYPSTQNEEKIFAHYFSFMKLLLKS